MAKNICGKCGGDCFGFCKKFDGSFENRQLRKDAAEQAEAYALHDAKRSLGYGRDGRGYFALFEEWSKHGLGGHPADIPQVRGRAAYALRRVLRITAREPDAWVVCECDKRISSAATVTVHTRQDSWEVYVKCPACTRKVTVNKGRGSWFNSQDYALRKARKNHW